jgi:hypothetical protein
VKSSAAGHEGYEPHIVNKHKLEGIMPASTKLSRPVAGHKTNCCLSDSVPTFRIEVRA